MPVMIS